ncbi:Pao retrotransposon peptidase [Popillia japonica]|uniref:Pao retrotransposon peptidase n=1 Tax=Popillia japonica TaxID=7064 RepID=A0AAW1LWC1_POPJA
MLLGDSREQALSRLAKLEAKLKSSPTLRIFDPLGLISPCIVTTKILLQKLWLCKLDWDDPIPPEICQEWLSFCSDLQFLKDIIIPRQVLEKLENNTGFDLIGFCDASQHAYASCVYARSIDAHKNVKIELFCSKTKVPPLKVLTIPRLELMSAVLLAELMSKVSKLLTVNHEVSYWSDSKIVLAWLNKNPKHLQTFVVAKIRF